MHEFAQAPATLVFDDFVRVYFSCRPKPDENGQYTSYSAWVDLDRKDLTRIIQIAERPILEMGGLGCFDEFGTYPVSVIRYQNKFRAYYAGWTRCNSVPFNVAVGVAESTDAAEFTRLGTGPVLGYTPNEPFVISGPKVRYFNDKYHLFYIAGKKWILDNGRPEPVYTIRKAESEDGLIWRRTGRELIPQILDENEAQASPDVIFLNGKYYMFFCYRYGTNYRLNERGYRIGCAISEDLENWQRIDDAAGLSISEEGWDDESVSYPHVFELDGEVYMMYLGNQVGRFGFGLAKLIEVS